MKALILALALATAPVPTPPPGWTSDDCDELVTVLGHAAFYSQTGVSYDDFMEFVVYSPEANEASQAYIKTTVKRVFESPTVQTGREIYQECIAHASKAGST